MISSYCLQRRFSLHWQSWKCLALLQKQQNSLFFLFTPVVQNKLINIQLKKGFGLLNSISHPWHLCRGWIFMYLFTNFRIVRCSLSIFPNLFFYRGTRAIWWSHPWVWQHPLMKKASCERAPLSGSSMPSHVIHIIPIVFDQDLSLTRSGDGGEGDGQMGRSDSVFTL